MSAGNLRAKLKAEVTKERGEDFEKLVKVMGNVWKKMTLQGVVFAVAANLLKATGPNATRFVIVRAKDRLEKLRKTKWGIQIDPSGSREILAFARAFLEKFAAKWDYTKDAIEGDKQELAYRKTESQIIDFWLDDAEQKHAKATRSYVLAKPDGLRLEKLRQIKKNNIATWPDISILRLAFGVTENVVRAEIKRLQLGVTETSNSVRKRSVSLKANPGFKNPGGKPPKRYGPKVVLALIDCFCSTWLPRNQNLSFEERTTLQKSVMKVKRALSRKISI